jgi:TP901 family phage tail tape measure protein
MVEVGKASVTITVDDDKLKSGLNAAHREVEGWATKASKSGQISLGAISGAAMGVTMMGVNAALQAADAIGPRAAMSWEKGMGGAIKTIGIDKFDPGTGQMSAAFKTLNADLLDLRANLRGTTSEDITGVAGALGSLGVAQDQIKGSTQIVLQNAAAFGMSSDDTATKLAQVNTLWAEQSTLLGGSSEVFKKTGSAVNELGNKYSATESNVLGFLSEAGGTAGVWDRSIADTAAFGALLETVGLKGPEAATALKSALNEGMFAGGVETSKEKKGYKLAASMLGISDQSMKDRLNKDLYGTLIDVSTAVDKRFGSDASGKSQAFKNIFGGYGVELGTKIAGKGDIFSEMLGTANQGFEEGTSAQAEYERQTDNLSGALDELKGAFDVLSITAWSGSLGPAQGIVEDVAEAVRGLTTALSTGDWSQFNASVDAMKQKLMDFVFGIDYGGIGSDILTSIVDSLESVNYDAVGQQLFEVLHGAWNWATGALSSSDTTGSFSKIFNALKAIVGPTFSDILKTATGYMNQLHDYMLTTIANVVSGFVVSGIKMGNAIVTGLNSAATQIYNILQSWYDAAAGVYNFVTTLGQGNGKKQDATQEAQDIADAQSGGAGWTTFGLGWGRTAEETAKINMVLREMKTGTTFHVAHGEKIGLDETPLRTLSADEPVYDSTTGLGFEEPTLENPSGLSTPTSTTVAQGQANVGNALSTGSVPTSVADTQAITAAKANSKDIVNSIGANKLSTTASDALSKLISGKTLTDAEIEAARKGAYEGAINAMGGLWAKPDYGDGPDVLKEGIFETANSLAKTSQAVVSPVVGAERPTYTSTKTGSDQWTAAQAAAAKDTANTLQGGSQVAANALRLGAEIFPGAVKIGVDGFGREVAVIGSVAQKQFEAAGGKLYTHVETGGKAGGSAMQAGGQQGGAAVEAGCRAGASALAGAAAAASSRPTYTSTKTGSDQWTDPNKKTSASSSPSASNSYGYYDDRSTWLNEAAQKIGGSKALVALPASSSQEAAATTKTGGLVASANAFWADLTAKQAVSATKMVAQNQKVTQSAYDTSEALSYTAENLGNLDGCAVSGFAKFQETTEGLFQKPFIGPTAAYTKSVQSLSATYNESASALAESVGYTARSSYDTSEALSHTAESMDNWCEAASDFAYWQETTSGLFQQSYIGPTVNYGGNGGGGGGGDYGGWTPDMYTGQPGTGYLDYIGYTLPPIFMASEAYVASPTLAVVGDRPGGEYVIGAARFEDAVSKMGGGVNITINSPITIQGDGNAAEFEAMLEKRNQDLVEQIAQAVRGL